MATNKMASVHTTVLLQETIDGLDLDSKENPVVVDATFGGGGHSAEICRRYPLTTLTVFDQDKDALERGKGKLADLDCKLNFINSNFREMDLVEGTLDGIVFDLGLSSDQLENSGRGFSFQKDEPLLMQMKTNPTKEDLTATEIVNTWEEKNLADIIYGYGEEKWSRKIAKAIVEQRKFTKIETTFDLVKIIENAVPKSYSKGKKINPATKTFQALRIAVNDELGALSEGLEKGFKFLKKGGRISVISFHSLEDRVVKRFYKNKAEEGVAKIINKKVITASEEEIKNNRRSRSAKLRILEKIK